LVVIDGGLVIAVFVMNKTKIEVHISNMFMILSKLANLNIK